MHDFLCSCKQRVVLNGQNSSWETANSGVPQGSNLETSLFLNYISNLSSRVSSNCKLFADDTSLFSVVKNIQSSAATLRNDLPVISNWAFQWKMFFNPDLATKAQEVIIRRKNKKLLQPCLSFNNISLKNSMSRVEIRR